MKKLNVSIFSIAVCFSLNVFAGGGGWSSDLVDPQQCVKLSGAQYTYNSSSNKCMQGINEGKIHGVSLFGTFYYGDGSQGTFKGRVSPGTTLNTNQDMNKTNKYGVKYKVITEWVR